MTDVDAPEEKAEMREWMEESNAGRGVGILFLHVAGWVGLMSAWHIKTTFSKDGVLSSQVLNVFKALFSA
jgi:hypothetical protein